MTELSPTARLDWRKPAAVSWYVKNVIGLHTSRCIQHPIVHVAIID